MYDFNKATVKILLSKEWILSRITEEAIFMYYHGSFKIGRAYCSKFSKDKNPSCSFFIGKNGKIIYTDFRNNQTWDCFDFVKTLYNCNFYQALERIAQDFGLIDRTTNRVPEKVFIESNSLDKEIKESTIIQFVKDKWNKENLSFWRQYEIKQEELERENVYPIKKLFINKKEIWTKNILRFAYPEPYEDKVGVKIYSPHDDKMKWVSSLPLTVPFGLSNFDWNSNEKICIITKSKKDLIICRKLFKNVLATQNESEGAFPEELQQRLLNTFEKIVIFFDNDVTGVNSSIKLNNKGFGYFNIPYKEYERFKIKDASDYVKYYGLDMLKELFISKNLL